MTPRGLDEQSLVTLPTRPVTCTVTRRQVERYLRQTGWKPREDGVVVGAAQSQAPARVVALVPDVRDREIPLSRIIQKIARHEKRYPGEVLADIAAGRGLERWIRRQKRWPSWP